MEKKEKIYSESRFSGLKDFQEKNRVNPIILSILIQILAVLPLYSQTQANPAVLEKKNDIKICVL